MAVGAVLGYLFGRGMVFLVNHIRLEYDDLCPVLSLTLVLLAYGITTIVGGNGFLAVYRRPGDGQPHLHPQEQPH